MSFIEGFLDSIENVVNRYDIVKELLPWITLVWCLPLLIPLSLLGLLLGAPNERRS